MVFSKYRHGMFSRRDRIPDTAEWQDRYARAFAERPDLVQLLEEEIRRIAADKVAANPNAVTINSTWLGNQILQHWEHQAEWNAYCENDFDRSRSLFGQVLWTVFWDDAVDWCTMMIQDANSQEEERIYCPITADNLGRFHRRRRRY